ncbi:MAG: hypothetical protein Ct9H90mP8_3600 [Pseudomonadota bacterium]|nr:MAG: hypothetical protein Ct9H90mP8_3600 [Pseudomonadota bacterium]
MENSEANEMAVKLFRVVFIGAAYLCWPSSFLFFKNNKKKY